MRSGLDRASTAHTKRLVFLGLEVDVPELHVCGYTAAKGQRQKNLAVLSPAWLPHPSKGLFSLNACEVILKNCQGSFKGTEQGFGYRTVKVADSQFVDQFTLFLNDAPSTGNVTLRNGSAF